METSAEAQENKRLENISHVVQSRQQRPTADKTKHANPVTCAKISKASFLSTSFLKDLNGKEWLASWMFCLALHDNTESSTCEVHLQHGCLFKIQNIQQHPVCMYFFMLHDVNPRLSFLYVASEYNNDVLGNDFFS